MSHYLLEKSRVCSQQPQERNYHVFYHLLAGASAEMKTALGLDSAAKFKVGSRDSPLPKISLICTHGHTLQYLSSAASTEPDVSDKDAFHMLEQSMTSIGMSPQEKADLFRVVAGVLHLGNLKFEEDVANKKGGCVLSVSTEQTMRGVASLLGVEMEDLRQSLTSRVMMTTKRGAVGTVIK